VFLLFYSKKSLHIWKVLVSSCFSYKCWKDSRNYNRNSFFNKSNILQTEEYFLRKLPRTWKMEFWQIIISKNTFQKIFIFNLKIFQKSEIREKINNLMKNFDFAQSQDWKSFERRVLNSDHQPQRAVCFYRLFISSWLKVLNWKNSFKIMELSWSEVLISSFFFGLFAVLVNRIQAFFATQRPSQVAVNPCQICSIF